MALSEKTFNKWFNAFILIGMGVAVILATALKVSAAETGRALLLISAVGSLTGILSTVCSANGIIWTFFFGFIDVTVYGVMCFLSGKYGNALLHLLYFVPMQFVGLWQWKRRGSADGTADRKVRARRLSSGKRLLFSGAFLAGSVAAYFVLARFSPDAAGRVLKMAVLTDAVSMVCNILGQYLMSTAYMEQWFFWIGVNVFSVIMWSITLREGGDSFSLIYLIKYAFYLVNSLNGLRIWLRLSREEG